MPLRLIPVLGILAALALAACETPGESSAPTSTANQADTRPSFVFLLHAPAGALAGNGETLSLRDPDPMVVFLSERPRRLTGHVPLDLFLSAWAPLGFADDPPAVAAVVDGAPANEDTLLTVLGQPRWDAVEDTLVFDVASPLDGARESGDFDSGFADERLPEAFGHVTLLIDASGRERLEFIVTPSGVINLRVPSSESGGQSMEVVPEVSYIGPSYLRNQPSAPTPSPSGPTPTPDE